MVDVDYPPLQPAAQIVRQDLHVTGQHDEIRLFLLDEFEKPPLLARLALTVDWQMMERDVVACRKLVKITMVGNDSRDVDGQRADAVAVEQIVQAMAEARNHDDGARAAGQVADVRRHLKALENGTERCLNVRVAHFGRRRKRHAHEEPSGGAVAILRAVGDVAAARRQTAGYGKHDARLIRAGERQNEIRLSSAHTRGSPCPCGGDCFSARIISRLEMRCTSPVARPQEVSKNCFHHWHRLLHAPALCRIGRRERQRYA